MPGTPALFIIQVVGEGGPLYLVIILCFSQLFSGFKNYKCNRLRNLLFLLYRRLGFFNVNTNCFILGEGVRNIQRGPLFEGGGSLTIFPIFRGAQTIFNF